MPRKTIYLSDEIMPVIGCDEPGAFSRRLTGIIQDWQAVIADAMPELKEAEWLYLMDMLNGVVLEGRQALFLGSDVVESGEMGGLGKKWDVDPRAFGKRIDALPLAGKVAIHDVAYRFWQRHGIVDSHRAVLEKCGAKLTSSRP
jgi:hypothetical protein